MGKLLDTRSLPLSLLPGLLLALSVSAVSAQEAPAETPAAASTEPAASEAAPAGDEALVRRRRRQGEAAPKPVDPDQPVAPVNRPMDSAARPVPVVRDQFRPDPSYPDHYDAEQQYVIYGGKQAISTPRPLLELGYPMYAAGEIGAGHTWFGSKNLVRPQLLVYGDWRNAYGDNRDQGKRRQLLSTRLNLDVDLKLTGTERLHALFRPLDQDGRFTRIEFKGAATPDGKDEQEELNADPVTAFFEGDLGQIAQGITGSYNGVDLPVAVGLVPLLFQNGIWLDDAFNGFALTIPARNSRALDISNFDITFFAGFDEVSSTALGLDQGKLALHAGRLYGMASFFEWHGGYYEFDYAYLDDQEQLGGVDHSYHNVSAAITRRWKNWLSYSGRVIHNFGQEADNLGQHTADGTLLLFESSFFTHKPYTLLPYLNLFYGEGSPQAAARDAGAGGVLKNTGLSFETDGLTGFPKMDDTGRNAYGGALGLQYLFSLDRQVVMEVSGLDRHGDDKGRGAEYALGLRYQQPLSRRWIFRADGVIGDRRQGDDFSGVRVELRCKF